MKNLLLILIALAFCPGSIKSAQVVIDDLSRSDINRVIKKCRPNDTIVVMQGKIKADGILIDRPLTITGKNYPEIEGNNKNHIFIVKSGNVSISGLKIVNSGMSYVQDRAAIRMDSSDNCAISGNIIENCMFGVFAASCRRLNIYGNTLTGNSKSESASGNGFHLWYCTDVKVTGNSITKHRDGVYLEFVTHIALTGNNSFGNIRYGLHFMFSNNAEYIKNTFKGNGSGVAVMYTKNVLMDNNNFDSNTGGASYGLLLKDISESRVVNNRFTNNTTGVYVEGGGKIRFENNTFRSNAWALRLLASSQGNVFTRNAMIGNSFDVTTNSTFNNNEFYENYWDKYNGYDIDRDGIGDVPYYPVRLFAYIVEKNPPLIILLHSFFVFLIEMAENIMPSIVPDTLIDTKPLMAMQYDNIQ